MRGVAATETATQRPSSSVTHDRAIEMSVAIERWSAFTCGGTSESHPERLYRRGIADDVLDRLVSLVHHVAVSTECASGRVMAERIW